jgi:uncharacterized protein YabE (DUF348 family)
MVWRLIIIIPLLAFSLFELTPAVSAQGDSPRLVSVYDRGVTSVFLTSEKTIGAALKAEGIYIDSRDMVEPAASRALIAPSYKINIYRARPVIVVDGSVRVKTVSPYQTTAQIARDVGITVFDEDITTLRPLTNFVSDGAGLQLTIIRAKNITIDLYGKKTQVRTHADTIADMLSEKNIILGASGRVSPLKETPVTEGMNIRIWREGKQTVTTEEAIPVTSRIVYDVDQPIGYRAVKTEGVPGARSISYQLEVRDGIEISRIEIANVITRAPTQQTQIVGLRNDGSGLTASKGAQYWTDSMGVSHRETYYDLNMSVVMRSCGQGGLYSVRPDGAKVDADGYVIIAANYGNYPKCSIVETSLGAGKVYDTGGFALRHPFGFDLATDWTRADGI